MDPQQCPPAAGPSPERSTGIDPIGRALSAWRRANGLAPASLDSSSKRIFKCNPLARTRGLHSGVSTAAIAIVVLDMHIPMDLRRKRGSPLFGNISLRLIKTFATFWISRMMRMSVAKSHLVEYKDFSRMYSRVQVPIYHTIRSV